MPHKQDILVRRHAVESLPEDAYGQLMRVGETIYVC